MGLIDGLLGFGAPSLRVGQEAPDFTLPDRGGKMVRLSSSGAAKLWFCTSIRRTTRRAAPRSRVPLADSYQDFLDAGAEVIGVSGDDSSSHERFATKYNLPFVLLSDRGGQVRAKYGVPATLGLLPGRVTFVIDRDGIVRHTFNSQFQPKQHIAEAITALRQLDRPAAQS